MSSRVERSSVTPQQLHPKYGKGDAIPVSQREADHFLGKDTGPLSKVETLRAQLDQLTQALMDPKLLPHERNSLEQAQRLLAEKVVAAKQETKLN